MGNSCGVDGTSSPFESLDTLRKRTQPPRFPCNIKAWRLYSDANRRCVTKVAPIVWNAAGSFDSKSCFLLLHTFQISAATQMERDSADADAVELLSSAADCMTPRGLRHAFSSGNDRPTNAFATNTTNQGYSYGVFLWNGKDADAVVKATALTKAFELERMLLDDTNVERLFNCDAALSSLSTALGGAPSRPVQPSDAIAMSLLDGNELFRWMVDGPRKALAKDGIPSWPHVAEAINAAKRERGDSDVESRSKRGGASPTVRKGNARPSGLAAPPKLSLGNINSMDIDTKQVMGKSESAIRQGELDRFRGVCSQVLPFLCVGAELVARDKDLLKQSGITHIVNCAGTVLENFHEGSFKYLKLYLYDAKTEDLGCLFYEVINFVEQARQSGGKVFIHCHQGVSRSCTCCIAYLIQKQGLTYEDAFATVQAARGICNPNTGFICQLLEFYRRLNEPMDKPRAFRIARHSNFPDSSYCARSVSPGTGPLKQDECVIIHTPTRVFLWRGSSVDDGTFAAAELHVERIKLNEGAPQTCETLIAGEGNEPAAFWNAAAVCGFTVPHDVASSPMQIASASVSLAEQRQAADSQRDALAAEDEAMRTGNRPLPGSAASGSITERKFVAPEPQGFELLKMRLPLDENPEPLSRRVKVEDSEPAPVKAENEDEGKLFTYPDWQELEMFDSDDLLSDMAVVLLPNKKPIQCVFVWMGDEFISDEGFSKGAELAGEFLALRGLSPTTEVIIEREGDESDPFWDFFVNG